MLQLRWEKLREVACPCCQHEGAGARPRECNELKEKSTHVRACADVASRGLDIPSVDVVVNYDLPNNAKEYVHRVGRTARAGRSGRALTLVTQCGPRSEPAVAQPC